MVLQYVVWILFDGCLLPLPDNRQLTSVMWNNIPYPTHWRHLLKPKQLWYPSKSFYVSFYRAYTFRKSFSQSQKSEKTRSDSSRFWRCIKCSSAVVKEQAPVCCRRGGSHRMSWAVLKKPLRNFKGWLGRHKNPALFSPSNVNIRLSTKEVSSVLKW